MSSQKFNDGELTRLEADTVIAVVDYRVLEGNMTASIDIPS